MPSRHRGSILDRQHGARGRSDVRARMTEENQDGAPPETGRFFKRTRGELTLLGFAIAALTLASLLIEVPQRGWRLVREHFGSEQILLIRNEVGFQRQLRVGTSVHGQPDSSAILWEGLFQISNLTDASVTIFDFDIEFPPKTIEGETWRLRRAPVLPHQGIRVSVFDTEFEMFTAMEGAPEGEAQKPLWEQHELPVTLEPHERKYFLFPIELEIVRDGEKVEPWSLETPREGVAGLAGSIVERPGQYRCVLRDYPVRVTIDSQKVLLQEVFTLVSPEGCYLVLQKAPRR